MIIQYNTKDLEKMTLQQIKNLKLELIQALEEIIHHKEQ
tara:strand:+ start:67 stop:183 length:117 start_codon:yes stop_codon:yes gene_type:complete